MVEFVIILTIIMALCAGMLWVSRLLTFDYWAQQEARYLAFEQEWVARSGYGDSVGEPKAKLGNSNYLHRPPLLDRLDVNKNVSDEGNVSGLLAFLSRAEKEKVKGDSDAPTMVASGKRDSYSIIETAYASENMRYRRGSKEQQLPDRTPRVTVQPKSQAEYEEGFVNILTKGGFGGKFCNAMAGVLERHEYHNDAALFRAPKCAAQYNKDFGVYLANYVDVPKVYRDFDANLQWGMGTGEALQETLEKEIAAQFYSFFDTSVHIASLGALGYVMAKRLGYTTVLFDSSVTRLISEMRYVGSSVAVGFLEAVLGSLISSPGNQNEEKAFEDTVNGFLHVDAANILPVIGNGFLLNPTYLPVPPTFGPLAPGIQSGLMKNVLYKESGLIDELVENSNKMAEVSYDATKGSFSAARQRFDTEGIILTSRFYLVTQPWHIPRRESPTGPYRQKGDQFDDLEEETDEGILRRRVFGLWLLPSNIGAFLDPLGEIPALSPVFAPIGAVLSVAEAPINIVKGLIADNPLLQLVDALSELPIIGSLVPTLPKWPAVRPDAYPGSTEMAGDRRSGGERNFEDYVTEQRNFNPPPNPEFHD